MRTSAIIITLAVALLVCALLLPADKKPDAYQVKVDDYIGARRDMVKCNREATTDEECTVEAIALLNSCNILMDDQKLCVADLAAIRNPGQ